MGLENTPVLDKVTVPDCATLLCPEWRVCGAGEQMRVVGGVGEEGAQELVRKELDPPPKGGREGAGADSRQILSPPPRGFQISPPP